MDREKISGYLSIARKGGNVILGSDKLKDYTKKLYLILLDTEAGKNAEKIAQSLATEKNIKVLKLENLGQLLALPSCKICGIKNLGLSEVIISLIEN